MNEILPSGSALTYNTYSEQPTEIVIAHVAPCGLDKEVVYEAIKDEAKKYGYEIIIIRISDLILSLNKPREFITELDRIEYLMDRGDFLRKETGNNAILAMMAVSEIYRRRKLRGGHINNGKVIWFIDSLKHSQEVLELQKIYSIGFHLISTHVDLKERRKYLSLDNSNASETRINKIVDRDKQSAMPYGQQTEKVFQYADYFLRHKGSILKIRASIRRLMGLLFGDPHINSTFNEYAMYLAYAASLRSGDLSRQVGAVIAKDNDIIALGANECPSYGGGLYWPVYDPVREAVVELSQGKDHVRGEDYNHKERSHIYIEICRSLGIKYSERIRNKLENTTLSSLTEYGRMVHAEMEAILSCARKGVSPLGATLYCTTFPCHNCAKHIIASGIQKIFYIQPYPKSKALKMHDDAMSLDETESNKVIFEPYVGVGPRRYVDFFSMDLGVGVPVKRKDSNTGQAMKFYKSSALPRLRMLPFAYREIEKLVLVRLQKYIRQ